MKRTISKSELGEILENHFKSEAKKGERVLVQGVTFVSDCEKISFEMKVIRPKKGQIVPQIETTCKREELLLRKIEYFTVPPETAKRLKNTGIEYVWQLVVLSNDALGQVRGVGKVKVRSIRKELLNIPGCNRVSLLAFRRSFFREVLHFSDTKLYLKPREELKLITSLNDQESEVERFIKDQCQ